MSTLTASLVGKLLAEGISVDESLILFWLGERSKPLERAKVMFLLTLWWETSQSGGLYRRFPEWYWSHQNLDRRWPSLKGNLLQAASRLCKQLRMNLKRERRERPKPIELRRMGVGYRDRGTLSNYKWSWKDAPGNVQVIYHELLRKLTDDLTKTHIKKAQEDLRKYPPVGVPRSRREKRSKHPDETLGEGSKPSRTTRSLLLTILINEVLRETESSLNFNDED
jgi:hypothetical protein